MLVGYGKCTKRIKCELRKTQQIWLLSVTERTESAHCVLPNISKACLLCVTKPENLRVLSFTDAQKTFFWETEFTESDYCVGACYGTTKLLVFACYGTPTYRALCVVRNTQLLFSAREGKHRKRVLCVCVCFTNALGFTERKKIMCCALRNAQ